MGILDAIRDVLGLTPRRGSTTPASNAQPTPAVTVRRVASPPRPQTESAYLPQDRHAELLVPGPDGMPPLRLARHNGALWLRENSTGLFINVDNRYLRRLGIWGAKIRGAGRYDGQAILGEAELVREPDNDYDPNAVAVHVRGAKVGYYNKGMARGLAKALDAGELLVARIISEQPPKVIAARPEVIEHLSRRR
ncbi:HIRAN domain-containing protein [Microbacterium stercoris]|uniref:HIRAN domain-containing protein n=1 Tax=Microbacterium stercoris TaxID=2820289 RepID=A0A939QKU5_9MICO|nr:HIRAN domain-containing protein [Microbacterium stercoris]MBO3664788.1 hypothetical protein [Microbacterium stercoris]